MATKLITILNMELKTNNLSAKSYKIVLKPAREFSLVKSFACFSDTKPRKKVAGVSFFITKNLPFLKKGTEKF
jgi:hypothetical protein